MIFKNRIQAGEELAKKLRQFKGSAETIVLGLPRGGAVVAAAVAKELGLPLDIIVLRKIGAPGNPEFAIGAITEDGEAVLDKAAIVAWQIPAEYIKQEITKETQEARRRLKLYRGERALLNLKNKTAILVDDGIATGATMAAAIISARAKGAKKVIVAAPVIAVDTLETLQKETDEVIYLDAPAYFGAVGAFYENFEQVEDEEVITLLTEATRRRACKLAAEFDNSG